MRAVLGIGAQVRAPGIAELLNALTTYALSPRTLQQINNVPIDIAALCGSVGNPNVWFQITADQPFLSYVSTVTDRTDPGVIPYEIFPSRFEY